MTGSYFVMSVMHYGRDRSYLVTSVMHYGHLTDITDVSTPVGVWHIMSNIIIIVLIILNQNIHFWCVINLVFVLL